MNRTIEAYNHQAEEYEQKFMAYQDYQKQINHFEQRLEPASHILDLGCGPGQNSAFFSQKGHKVHGIDLSESMIKRARINCPDGRFTRADVSSLQEDEQYDALCLSFIIVHLSHEECLTLLEQLNRLCHPGSLLYLSFMSGKKPGYETTSFSDREIFFNYYKADELIKRLESCGFTLLEQITVPYPEADGSTTDDHFLHLQYRVGN